MNLIKYLINVETFKNSFYLLNEIGMDDLEGS